MMDSSFLRTWSVRLTYFSIALHLVLGALLPLLVKLSVFDSYHSGIEAHFWGASVPPGARPLQTWWMSLFGPTVQAAAVWMFALAWLGDRQRNAFAWGALIAGLLLWAPQDMFISLQAGVWAHVWLDSLALAGMLPPLVALFIIDRRRA